MKCDKLCAIFLLKMKVFQIGSVSKIVCSTSTFFVTCIILLPVFHTIARSDNTAEVFPVKVHPNGTFLSRNLTSSHEDGLVYYNLTIDDRIHLLQLEPSTKFIGPVLTVERRRLKNHIRERIKPQQTLCHFQGNVRGQENSYVAVSACKGLVGMIKTENERYHIEPLSPTQIPKDELHKHLLTKRSYRTYKNKNRKKRKRRKYPRNCGTKDKKLISRLQWVTSGKIKLQDKSVTSKYSSKYSKLRSTRVRRSVSRPHFVEVLLVADNSMVVYHEEWDLTTYLLTIMNMVSSLYMDPSIGNMIHIVVVKIIIIEDAASEPDLVIERDSDKTLMSFCKWQKKLNPENDSNPLHHDVAVLITRKDICSVNGCNTLGIARVGGICSSDENCNVNEDNGITLALTIAHEIGHNLGLTHDTEKKGCKEDHRRRHIMTDSFQADLIGMTWSQCSRNDITNFLDKGLGSCLHDKPQEEVPYIHSDLPAGAMYDANYQCRLQHSVNATDCSYQYMEEICYRLWCQEEGTCSTKLLPAAPGTSCGKHKWCQNLQCVDIMDNLPPVDGGWGEWSAWSPCSRTCGAGVSISERKCDHPRPSGGGNYCLGTRRRYRMCKTEPCHKHTATFRAMQCSFYNNHLYQNKKFEWLPYYELTEPCKLYCVDSNNTIVMSLGDYAQDGTPCNVGTNDICIAGICQKVGCDWIVGSNATEDECGVCEGDNTKCNIFNGTYEKQSVHPGYREIVVVPAGATNIKIIETNASENYLSISSALHNKYYLNGRRHISLPGEYDIAGSTALYERAPIEKVRIPGPIEDSIVILVVFVGMTSNPGIYYQYSLFKPELTREVLYDWSYTDWTQCSATCGGGIQEKLPVCKEIIASSNQYKLDGISTIVDEIYCEPDDKPKEQMRACNEWLCQTHWWVGPWQSCPVTCSNGETQMRKRSVMCVDGQDMALPDSFCDRKIKPDEYELCGSLPPCDSD